MDGVIPARNGKAAARYTWDEDGAVQNVEPLEQIQEGTAMHSSKSNHTPQPSRSGLSHSGGLSHQRSRSVIWPFHNRTTSGVASTTTSGHFQRPSTHGTGHFRAPSASASSHFRRATAQTKSWFRAAEDSASVLSRSLVPDYVVNYMRGETPETLARKREQRLWGERDIQITPQRERFMSQQAYFDDPWSSRINLTSGEKVGDRQRSLRGLFNGWRGGVTFNAFLSLVILLVAVICLVIMVTKPQVVTGAATILSGSCASATTLNTALHVLINVLTIIILAGGNYVFQLLTSPTRAELAAAHDKKQWLDIGIPSLRNYSHISGFRASLATIVLVAAVATQVIYNSIIFTTHSASEAAPDTCSVSVSTPLMGAVALLNFATLFSIVIVLARAGFRPLATLGDAIQSFLEYPDSTTRGSCLLTKKDVKTGHWGSAEARYVVPGGHFWFCTPSLGRWALLIVSWVALAAPTAGVLGKILPADPEGLSTPFGTSTLYTTFALPTSMSESELALLASLPQLLLAILYLATNSHLTTYYLSHELSLYAVGPQPLRVSADPVGYQRTSLFLTLPRPISWMLLAFFVAMGFVLSQAVFPEIVTSSSSGSVMAISFSTKGLLALLALLGALLFVVLGFGLRRAPAAAVVSGQEKGNPLVLRGGSCSAVLSAKCHPVVGEIEAWKRDLRWGVVTEGLGMQEGRCAFSAMEVGVVDVGRTYA
ncbi:hypothetical protein JX266_003779 [Neoarthrinium moseri]|nr:hypothetical protein JX266_003779 [Neoarthrinium moseri]